MLTKLWIQNFKQFEDVEIELGQSVVFIGPNNSGKTTALQALALWGEGISQWLELPKNEEVDRLASILGVIHTLNRYDLVYTPVAESRLLWRNLKFKNSDWTDIQITVGGVASEQEWSLSLDFRYENEELLRCNINRRGLLPEFKDIPPITFVPSMSGIAAVEPRLEPGRIEVLLGEGRTAEVLRNLCLNLYELNGRQGSWDKVVSYIRQQFGIELLPPQYLPSRGEIRMSYKDRNGVTLDLASSGRGMLQILLLLAYMYNNPGAVLLLDEPDAHLEILRQRQIYQLLTSVAQEQGSQIIAATHSEVVLEEAANRDDTIIAFLGKPHRITKTSEVLKSLRDIPFDEYYLAEEKGWVLYLEGTTDLDILRAFADRLNHPAVEALKLPFVYYLESNYPSDAEKHFNGVREAKPNLIGFALFDQTNPQRLHGSAALKKIAWQRREIENYFALPNALIGYARTNNGEEGAQTMTEVVRSLLPPVALNNPNDPYWFTTKVSDELLPRVFTEYAKRLNLPSILRKGEYYLLVPFIPTEEMNPEVTEKLDAIVEVAGRAQPRKE